MDAHNALDQAKALAGWIEQSEIHQSLTGFAPLPVSVTDPTLLPPSIMVYIISLE